MKKLIPLLLALVLLLSSCIMLPAQPTQTDPPYQQQTTDPTETDPTVTDPTVTDLTETDPTDAPTDPDPTDAPTDPDPTDAPTDPPATEPQPTDPPVTEPQPTDPPVTEPSTPAPDDSTDPSGDWLYINYVDVGQGDCIFIKLGDYDILIDAGKSQYGSTVVNYLNKVGVDDIELMINTHPDNDHYGGLPAVLDAFDVEAAWISGFAKSNNQYNSFKSDLSAEGLTPVTPATGSVHTYGDLTITVVSNGSGASNSNDSSLVLMFEYGNFRFLFTGDISSTIESKMLSSGADLRCDILKVGHHGSRTSSSANFLAATQATYGVICVGTGNSYGHPTSDALNRLSSADISVYRTDLHGDVVFSTDGTTLHLPDGSASSITGSAA